MPSAAPKPCAHPGCGVLVRDGSSRCAKHPASSGFASPLRGSSQSRGYGWEWQKLRSVVLRRDKGLCQPCKQAGKARVAKAVDHIVNKASGGTDDLSNLQGICKDCHTAKTALESSQARQRI